MQTQICKKCHKELPLTKFKKQYKGPRERATMCHVCNGSRDRATQNRSPLRREKYLEYKKRYKDRWPFYTKICGYRQFDKANAYASITQSDARTLLCSATECVYCGNTDQQTFGLDRRNNDDGHHLGNVVVCCEICNVILADLPAGVKDLLAPGLRASRQMKLLDNYVVPYKRQMTRKKRNELRKSI